MYFMKTLKQLSEELGKSKTAIRKKIEKLGLRSRLHQNGNQFLIDEETETLIKQAFSLNQETNSETNREQKTETDSETVSVLVSILQKELDSKNEQILHLQKLLDQEQQLRMVTEQKLLLIEEQKKEEPQKKFWEFWK